MKAYCTKILLFLSPLVALGALFETALRQIPNDYSYKRGYLDTYANEIEVLILGNSHSYYDIDPAFLTSRAFNASHVSQSIRYDSYILGKYWQRLEHLRVVVWPISYFSLFSELEEGPESWRVKNYAIYYGCPYHKYSLRSRLEILNGTMTGHVRRLAGFLRSRRNDISCTETGCVLRPPQPMQQDLLRTGVQAATRHQPHDTSHMKCNLDRLETWVRQCQQNGIQVVFLTTPAWTTYSSRVSQDDLHLATSALDGLCDHYDNAIYVNYLTDSRFGEEDFRNADHFNAHGAQKFSQMVNGLIEERLHHADHPDGVCDRRVSAAPEARD
jgi:hypothetical protein